MKAPTELDRSAFRAGEPTALLWVARLIAEQAPREKVFAQVTDELGDLLGLDMVRTVRYEPDGTATTLAARGAPHDRRPPGTNFPLPEGGVLERVLDTGRPAYAVDYAHIGGPTGASLREEGVACAAAGPIIVDGDIWGAMVVAAQTIGSLPPGSEERVAQFAQLASTAISNLESRAKIQRLAAEQSALRRVATAVARHAPAGEVFARVTEELHHLLGVDLMVRMARFDPDGTATILAAEGMPSGVLTPGTNVPLPAAGILDQVFHTGRPGRVDDYTRVGGPVAAALLDEGVRCAVAGPIKVDGATWGAMAVASTGALPPDSENRVAEFAELVSTAISNLESRAQVERLAAEQSSLRRVATLVAREHSPDDLFSMLAKEVGILLEVDGSEIQRFEPDASMSLVASWSDGDRDPCLGPRSPLVETNLSAAVQRTGRPQRWDCFDRTDRARPVVACRLGVRSAVGSPIVVEGTPWGMIAVFSRNEPPLPTGTVERLAEFCTQASIAVANAKSRSDLAESRARIVRTADEARRRVERDLHDGVQQRLVSIALQIRAAQATVPSELDELAFTLSRLAGALTDVLDGLRELSRGIHPALLSDGGLDPALSSLARRSTVPVALDLGLDGRRFEEAVEVAAYYVTSEALANTAKHASATRIDLIARHADRCLELSVADDGIGGADQSNGTGLTGLIDRVEAIGGTIAIDSRPALGTRISVRLPARPSV